MGVLFIFKSYPVASPVRMFEIVCSKCGAKIYNGDEVKSPRQILRLYKGQCKKCGAKLNPEEFDVLVSSNA
jgi:hypothetical protein